MPRNNKLKTTIYKEIVEESGGTVSEIESIVESQFAFLKKNIETGEFAQIRLPYLGKFYVKPVRLSKLNHAVVQRGKL